MLHKVVTAFRVFRDQGLQGGLSRVRTQYGFLFPQTAKSAWRDGIAPELEFWDSYFRTKGLQWSDTYERRFNPQLPLQPRPLSLLPDTQEVFILDVGAGPLTYLGKVAEGKKINIIAVDPLADEYNKILNKYMIEPIVRTQKADAEKLVAHFPRDTFDLVYARNCIDHSYAPVRAIRQMLSIVKKGCYILMEHHPEEATAAGHHGFHQWDFTRGNSGHFIIVSRRGRWNVTETFRKVCDVRCEILSEAGQRWIVTSLRKK